MAWRPGVRGEQCTRTTCPHAAGAGGGFRGCAPALWPPPPATHQAFSSSTLPMVFCERSSGTNCVWVGWRVGGVLQGRPLSSDPTKGWRNSPCNQTPPSDIRHRRHRAMHAAKRTQACTGELPHRTLACVLYCMALRRRSACSAFSILTRGPVPSSCGATRHSGVRTHCCATLPVPALA